MKPETKEIIEKAIKAIQERAFYAQWPEHPKAYNEELASKGKLNYEAYLGNKFNTLKQDNSDSWGGEEISPFSNDALGIEYPLPSPSVLIKNGSKALKSWRKTSVDDRAEVLIDSLNRIADRFFDIAYATMHTTGQSFMMSFQASGPHANDRALEALALGYQELKRYPNEVLWEKPMGKFDLRLKKWFKPVPKGVGLVIGCSTFPVWNSVPGMYASMITGNPIIVKPHPKAILPIAIVVEEIQNALSMAGMDPHICQLAADSSDHLITKELAEDPSITLIDYTGGSAFGDYIEGLKGKTVFTEKAGVNSVIIDSTSDIDKMVQNLTFSVALYSGQMCTAPQNFFIPKNGIKSNGEQKSYDEVVDAIKNGLNGLVHHPKMGAGTLGAVQNEVTFKRANSDINQLQANVVLEAGRIENPEFQQARVCSPAILEVDSSNKEIYEQELFGPVMIIVKTESTDESISLAKNMAMNHGAITCAAYSTDVDTQNKIEEAMEEAYTPVSFNLMGPIWVNQHAAFSDFHVTGGNPAGNASFVNPEYVNKRFVWVGHRTMA